MKITALEMETRWSARADASIDGPPAGYRFCHIGGHMAKLGTTCGCKVPTNGQP